MILGKVHVCESSGSSVMAKNIRTQLDSYILWSSVSLEGMKQPWFFAWRYH